MPPDIVRFMNDVYLVTDVQGLIQQANPAAAAMFGGDDLVGRSLLELVDPDARAALADILNTGRTGTDPGRWQGRLISRGTPVSVHAHIRSGRDPDGRPTGFSWLIQRRDGQHAAVADALQRSENRYRELVQNANSAIIRWSRDGTITFLNEFAQKLFGWSADEVIGKHVGILVPERESTGTDLTGLVQDIVEHPDRYVNIVNENICRDGRRVWMAWTNRAILDEHGRVTEILAVGSDVTDRKYAEDAVNRTTQRYALLAETAGALLRADDPQTVVEDLCDKVMRHLDCDVFFNFLAGEGGERLYLNACAGISAETAEKIRHLDFGVAVCGSVAQDRRRIIAHDIQHTPDQRTDLIKTWGVQAYCCHPLMAGDRLIGTLSFGTKRRTHFTDDETELMRAVSDQVAVAMERKRALEAQRRLAQFPEENPNPVLRIAADGAVMYANEAGQAWLAGQDVPSEGMTPAPARALLTQAWEKDGPLETELLHPSGRTFWFAAVRPPGESYVNFYGRDVTDRKRTEEALRAMKDQLEIRVEERTAELAAAVAAVTAERQRFHDVLDMMPVYAILLDPDYRVPFANRFFEDRFGKSQGRRCYEYLFGRSEPCEICETFKVLRTGAPHRWDWTGPDGRDYEVYDFPFTDADGSPLIMEVGLDVTDRKRAQAALEELNQTLECRVAQRTEELVQSRKDLDRAQEVGQIGSWRLDARQNVLTWSDETYRIFGVPSGVPLTYETFLEVVHPDDREYVDARWNASGRGEPYDIEHRIVVDGQVKWVREKAYLEFDDDGGLLGGFGIAQDITDRKRWEQQLQASEERYRSLFNAMNEGFGLHEMLFDGEGRPCDYRFLDVNPAFERLTGLKRADILGRTVLEVLPGNDPMWIQTFGRVVQTGEPTHLEQCSTPLDRWYEVFAYRPAENQFACVFLDVTERRRADEALRARERQVREQLAEIEAIYESAPVGLCVFDREMRYVRVNKRLAEINGVPAEEHLGRTVREVVPDLVEPVERLAQRIFRTGEPVLNIEITGATPAQPGVERIWIEHWLPLKDEHGRVEAINVVAHEVTEQKQVERTLREFNEQLQSQAEELQTQAEELQAQTEELRRARNELEERVRERTAQLAATVEDLSRSNQDLQQFAYASSHDLQEPLRQVASFVQMLDRKYRDKLDDDGRQYMGLIVEGAVRMSQLIKGLLAYSRVNSQGGTPEPVRCDEALARARANLRLRIEEAGAQLVVDPLPTVRADATQLTQVFQNLIENAIKFRRDDRAPHVHIAAEPSNGEWVFCVRDNGIGIEPQYLDQIFVVFKRLHADRERFPGAGIGLALVKRIIERHGGRMWVASEYGEGTAFYFSLPGE